MQDLTTTSYALLGLLAVRPWSAYELAKYMQQKSSVGAIWPRTVSKLYEEPKKLVAHGFAIAKPEQHGGRSRTVYRITRQGRQAMRDWLSQPGAGPTIEFEAMLKVIHADQGSREDLLTHLDQIAAEASATRTAVSGMLMGMLERGPALPQRLHTNLLVAKHALDFAYMNREWAIWARRIVETWPATQMDAELAEQSHALLQQLVADLSDEQTKRAPAAGLSRKSKDKLGDE